MQEFLKGTAVSQFAAKFRVFGAVWGCAFHFFSVLFSLCTRTVSLWAQQDGSAVRF